MHYTNGSLKNKIALRTNRHKKIIGFVREKGSNLVDPLLLEGLGVGGTVENDGFHLQSDRPKHCDLGGGDEDSLIRPRAVPFFYISQLIINEALPNCAFPFCTRVLFVYFEALLFTNSWFSWTRLAASLYLCTILLLVSCTCLARETHIIIKYDISSLYKIMLCNR